MIVIFNAVLALVVAGVLISTINNMQDGKTPPAVMLSMVLIFAGMLGQGVGVLSGKFGEAFGLDFFSWDHFVDTLLYGGLLAFVLACRRFPISKRKVAKAILLDRLSIGVSALTLLCALVLLP